LATGSAMEAIQYCRSQLQGHNPNSVW